MKKKKFLNWFLVSVGTQSEKERDLIQHFINHPYDIENLNFIMEDSSEMLPLILIAAPEYSKQNFRYITHDRVFLDPQQIITDLENNPDLKLFIKFEFPNRDINFRYAEAVEDIHCDEMLKETDLTIKDYSDINHFMEILPLLGRKERILKEIDASLDNFDKEAFLLLHTQLKEAEEMIAKCKQKHIETRNPRLYPIVHV